MEKKIRNILRESGVHGLQQDIITKDLLVLYNVVGRSEQLACDCDRQPLRYNELGTCKYCGKQKPSEG